MQVNMVVPIPKQEREENLKEIKDWNWEKVTSAKYKSLQ
jgi:hypothetical protein